MTTDNHWKIHSLCHTPINDLLTVYGRKLWLLIQVIDLRRFYGVEPLVEVSYYEQDIQYWIAINHQSQDSSANALNSTSRRYTTRDRYYRESFIPLWLPW